MNPSVISLRMQRQHLLKPASKNEYNALFKLMSPVQTVYWTAPGNPPSLPFHATFNDYDSNFAKRARREIVKGRFQNGGVAYVFADELELFAAAYKKDASKISYEEEELLEFLRREGPMNIGMIKEFTGMLTKTITPLLHSLQEKFLVFEDQADNEGDRAWYIFESEFPETDINKITKINAIKELILRFAYLNVLIDPAMVRSFYRFSVKDIKTALEELLQENRLEAFENGFILPQDKELFAAKPQQNNALSIIPLHRNDFLVKSNEHWLKDQFKHPQYDIRHYLLINGEFHGAIMGFFKFTDVPIEDIILDLPAEEALNLKEDVLKAASDVINFQTCPLKRYMGQEL